MKKFFFFHLVENTTEPYNKNRILLPKPNMDCVF